MNIRWEKDGLEQELIERSKTQSTRVLAEHFGTTINAVRMKTRRLRKQGKLEPSKRRRPDSKAKKGLTLEEFLAKLAEQSEHKRPTVIDKPLDRAEAGYEAEAVVLRLSDSHVGKKINKNEVQGLNEYSTEIFLRRLDVLSSKVIRICKVHRAAYTFTELVVLFLGDIIDGEQIFAGQRNYIDQTVIDQVLTATDAFSGMIRRLFETGLFPKVRVEAVWGNHGRVGRKNEYDERCNFDYLAYKIIEASLRDIPVEFNISESYFLCVDVEGYKFLLMHGDNIRSYHGIPFYGMSRMDNAYARLVGEYAYLELGHFHQASQIANNGTLINVNGSWVGGDIYSAKQLYVMSRPCQVMTGVHHRHGISWRYDIDLREEDQLESNNQTD